MHDTRNLELRGIPTLFVATLEFEDGARAQARALGCDPAAVYVPHPIQDRSDAELRAIADGALPGLLQKLVREGS